MNTFLRSSSLSGMPRLWRADHALKALVKRLLTPSEIPLAAQKDVPRKREPTAEASEARRLTPSAADHVLLRRLAEQRWTVEELRWVATHLDPRAPTIVVEAVQARLRELEAAGEDHPVVARAMADE